MGFMACEISCIKHAVEQRLHLEDKRYNPRGKEGWYCSKSETKRNKAATNAHNKKGSL